MTYRIHYAGAEGIPLNSVLDDMNEVVCIPPGGTFSAEGIKRIRRPMRQYEAAFPEDAEDGEVPTIRLRAYDLEAALMYLRHAYTGAFDLWVCADPVYLGEFVS